MVERIEQINFNIYPNFLKPFKEKLLFLNLINIIKLNFDKSYNYEHTYQVTD